MSQTQTPAQIEAEIEATRTRLAGTVDELAIRVQPKEIARRSVVDAKAKLQEATHTEDGCPAHRAGRCGGRRGRPAGRADRPAGPGSLAQAGLSWPTSGRSQCELSAVSLRFTSSRAATGRPAARHAANPPSTSVARRSPSCCSAAAASEEV